MFINDEESNEERFWGFTIVLIRLSKLLEAVNFEHLVSSGYNYKLTRIEPDSNKCIFLAQSDEDLIQRSVSVRIKVPNGSWDLYIAPREGWYSPLYIIIELFFALLIGIVTSLLAYKNFKSTNTLRMTNEMLTSEITERKLAEERIRALNESLERRVAERTADLAKTNEKLVTEINERKRTEESLRVSESKYQDLYDNAPDMFISIDAKTAKILRCNQILLTTLGYSKEEIIGRTIYDLYHPDCTEDVKKAFRLFVETGKVNNAELQLKRKDGGKIDVTLNVSAVRDKNGKILYSRSIWRDITERKKMEEELIKVQKLESMGILAGGIAHDFNNYLQGILSNIAIANRHVDTNNEFYGNLEEAEKAVLQAKGLAQQLLTFSKGGEPVKKTISISELIMDSANLALCGSNVRCEFGIPDGLRQVEADKGQMSQVFNNLFINANQAMQEGGIIKVKAENTNVDAKDLLQLQEGKYAMITIKDQGTGIPQKYLQKIFDPYFTTRDQGSGLGLAIAYSIIKKHDGLIYADSEMGVGTTFHIYFPTTGKEIFRATATRETEVNDTEETTPMTGRRILFMEDDAIIRLAVARELRNLNHDVETTGNGTEAIKLYKRSMESGITFDAVILDLTIVDGMGGEETIKKLLEIDPDVKAIVASGFSNDTVMANFRKYGFKGVVAKPYEVYELDEILQNILSGAL